MSALLGFLIALTFSLIAHAGSLSTPAYKPMTPHSNVIYGEDTRVDLYDVHDPKILALADSTVAMIAQKDLDAADEKSVKINLDSYAEANQLCPTERFYDQLMAADCSGFLITPTRIATAGHCIRDKNDCANYAFAFGFALKNKGETTPASLPASEIYSCKRVVASKNLDDIDFAIVELDRPVTNHKPLKFNLTGQIADGTPLFVIGYPAGLPAKFANKASVRSQDETSFISNLDTYHSNSGSAVFNATTNLVEGILVTGEVDFVDAPKMNCRVSKVCANDGCRGEAATKASVLKRFIF